MLYEAEVLDIFGGAKDGEEEQADQHGNFYRVVKFEGLPFEYGRVGTQNVEKTMLLFQSLEGTGAHMFAIDPPKEGKKSGYIRDYPGKSQGSIEWPEGVLRIGADNPSSSGGASLGTPTVVAPDIGTVSGADSGVIVRGFALLAAAVRLRVAEDGWGLDGLLEYAETLEEYIGGENSVEGALEGGAPESSGAGVVAPLSTIGSAPPVPEAPSAAAVGQDAGSGSALIAGEPERAAAEPLPEDWELAAQAINGTKGAVLAEIRRRTENPQMGLTDVTTRMLVNLAENPVLS